MFLPPEQLGDLIDSYVKDSVALKEQMADICYFMHGGVEWNTAWGMSYEDREIMIKVINKRIKEQNPGGKEYM
jgi:hypothetical protein